MNTPQQKRFFMQATKITLALFVSTVLILWAWNTTVVTLFGLPAMRFKEAVGLLILAMGVSWVLRGGQHRLSKLSGSTP